MSAPTLAEITISRAYRIHVDGKLIGFVWKQYGAWLNSRSTEIFAGRQIAIEAMLNQEDEA
jgi:hypothetical protein